jgi:hypothetical protein
MRAGGLDGMKTSERAEIATIPGATEQGREVPLGLPEGMEHGGEFLRERKQAAVRGRMLIAQSVDKGRGRQANGGDAFGDPRAIDFREEAANLIPACSLASLAGFADQHDEKVESMIGGLISSTLLTLFLLPTMYDCLFKGGGFARIGSNPPVKP